MSSYYYCSLLLAAEKNFHELLLTQTKVERKVEVLSGAHGDHMVPDKNERNALMFLKEFNAKKAKKR